MRRSNELPLLTRLKPFSPMLPTTNCFIAAVDDLHDQLRQNAVEMWRTLNETERVRWLVENIDGHLLLADEDIDEAIENAKLFA